MKILKKTDYSDYDSEDSDIENSVGSYKLFEDTTDKLYKGLSKFLNNIKRKEAKILNKQIKHVDSESDFKYIYILMNIICILIFKYMMVVIYCFI